MTSPTTRPDGRPLKQVRLGAHFPGVNATTVWSDPASGSHIDFSSFVHLARTAEAGFFDFFFLAEGLRLREKKGLIHDLDVVGRPDTLPVLAALAAVTDHLGLVGTINATFNEPFELARQFATLDHVSAGRAGWNLVTSSDAFTGENFRRGGFLDHADRYTRAAEILATARELWSSWSDGDVVADADGDFLARPDVGAFAHHGRHFDVEGQFSVARSPQGEPIVFQAGDSDEGRTVGARHADAIFALPRPYELAQEYYQDVKSRAVAAGRSPDELLILPGATFALGDTAEEAEHHAAVIRRQQISGQTALQFLELTWRRDLSAYDPDGPLPDVDPDPDGDSGVQGQARLATDVLEQARQWRELAEAKQLSIRDLVIEVSARQTFIGTPRSVAEQIDHWVQTDRTDGFILVPHITPTGLDEFVAKVVPELQDRGVLRTEYTGTTLRENLGLPARTPVLEGAS